LGFADLNQDGRKDVIIKEGWFEMPKDLQSEWTFHALSTKFDCAQMYVYDFDKDGDMDILSSSAHDYGIWWNETKSLATGEIENHLIDKSLSQTHSMQFVDLNGDKNPDFIVTKLDIVDTIAKATKIPRENLLSEKATENLITLESTIKERLYGQDTAVDEVLEKIYVAKAGMKSHNKPVGNFLFLGPTGTGKTEFAKLLSDNLSMKLLRYDMSEYQEKHAMAKLIGAPPGYVGYEDGNLGGGLLISDVERNPHCIILMDEIEKAHPDISNLLLQIMDEGFITGSNGKKADCRNAILILTSNLGAADGEQNAIGFGRSLTKEGTDDEAAKKFFKPEFRNRLDAVVKFAKLDEISMKKIVVKFLNELNDLLEEKNIRIRPTEQLIDHIADIGFDPAMGARPLARKINELIKVPLSKKILFDHIDPGSIISVVYSDEIKFTFITPTVDLLENKTVDENGIIVV
jgi:ATP-dependent Clp protease ATP-binding subunit ClpA